MPWESYISQRPYIMKERGQQLEKNKPDQPSQPDNFRYIQNEEQDNNTIWNRLKRD